MAYLEMSRDPEHGGGDWGFKSCVWTPERKRDGKSWVFWRKIGEIRPQDVVFHLRGASGDAEFVGYSLASSSGFLTHDRPPRPGKWGFSDRFYRANLGHFTPFEPAVNLKRLFRERRVQITEHIEKNEKQKRGKRSIFCTIKNNRPECKQGAYVSDLDDELLEVLFGRSFQGISTDDGEVVVSVETGSKIREAALRIGQAAFAERVKDSYGVECCFPRCQESDARLLVASHIDRWSDNKQLRGDLGNGLCLCVLHDKAFEVGIFTVDEDFRVFVSPRETGNSSQCVQTLVRDHGRRIKVGAVEPLRAALREHWKRVGLKPGPR